MPYSSFTKTKGGVRVAKRGGGGFTAHTSSVAEAKRTARLREYYSHRRNPGASALRRG